MAKKVRGESHPKPKRASWPASRDEETPEDRAHLDAKLAHQFAEFARLDAKAAPLIVEAERVVEDMTLCATSSAPAAARRAAARRLGWYVPVRLLPEERQALGLIAQRMRTDPNGFPRDLIASMIYLIAGEAFPGGITFGQSLVRLQKHTPREIRKSLGAEVRRSGRQMPLRDDDHAHHAPTADEALVMAIAEQQVKTLPLADLLSALGLPLAALTSAERQNLEAVRKDPQATDAVPRR
jgi:hypothetical protein